MNLNLQVVLQLSDIKLSFGTPTSSVLQELNAKYSSREEVHLQNISSNGRWKSCKTL